MPIATPAITVASTRPTRWKAGANSSPPPRPSAGDDDDAEHAMHRAQARKEHAEAGRAGRESKEMPAPSRPHVCDHITLRKASRRSVHGRQRTGPDRPTCALASRGRRKPPLWTHRRWARARTRSYQDPSRTRPRAIARWLLAVAALVVLMVAVGGITRLTESGLSITEWKPVTGALPPLTEAQWQAEFAAYQKIGEYRQIRGPEGMTLADYKGIYFWEWLHRLLGRLIGVAFAAAAGVVLGAAGDLQRVTSRGCSRCSRSAGCRGCSAGTWFARACRKRLPTSAISGSRSTCSRRWSRSPGSSGSRSTCSRSTGIRPARPARVTRVAAVTGGVLLIQLVLGAWVAGLNAGHASDTWPLMQGRLVPEVDWSKGAGWAFTHDPFLLHFLHRWWAWVAVAALVVLARRAKPVSRRASIAIHTAFGTQIVLGIATVLSGVDIELAGMHQLVGALLVAATAWGGNAVGAVGSRAW